MNASRDEQFMCRALRLAALGRHASPNPMVGCVLAAPDGRVVGEGYHPQAGMPHAEVYALRQAGARARGATAYVSLEPCAHHGRTPPCADALWQAGVARVVAALTDPDPRVAGRGLERLRAGGVDVTVGVGETAARALNAAFLKHRTSGLPWVVLKTAMTLDGKVAAVTGDSRWITSPLSRKAVHRQLRDRCDALLTGVGTVLADDPALTTRLGHRAGRDPLRVIVDSRCRTPLDSQVVRRAAEDGKTLIATTAHADTERREALAAHGCRVLVCESDLPGSDDIGGGGRVDLADLMRRLGTQDDIIGVLVESGGGLAAGLLATGLVDRWLAFVAPKIVCGRDAPGPVGGVGFARMADALPVREWRTRRCGPDLVIDARFG
ncbi:MAG: bifunctional diaminohydroxyphosphoribosylaminopyrimidine deaminase/5-amino-6-(5-phosphoribosylamino)uracil reductase RibD [Armatimonadetes bacterium]|nr:bifunctional diaminohydroxyphosphoribosylaminopyrimidine deaminase/5-amino-6-(5-phosphoribosylamino)uracil reductase RibD [Armatimonadota bacterium]